MNKAQLISRVARDRRISKVQAARTIDTFLDHITRALKKGDRASLVGFGTFTVVRRRARKGRNPQTGEAISIPARRVTRFTAGRALKAALR
jgi:DNA-binding protein HU-beta